MILMVLNILQDGLIVLVVFLLMRFLSLILALRSFFLFFWGIFFFFFPLFLRFFVNALSYYSKLLALFNLSKSSWFPRFVSSSIYPFPVLIINMVHFSILNFHSYILAIYPYYPIVVQQCSIWHQTKPNQIFSFCSKSLHVTDAHKLIKLFCDFVNFYHFAKF